MAQRLALKPSLLLIALLVGGCAVGVGQTKDSILTIKGTGEFLITKNTTWNYQWGKLYQDGRFEFSDNFWLAFAAKWREYEAECRKDSVLHEWWGPHVDNESGTTYGSYRRERWVYRNPPTFPGFILWLERKK